jgi:hypothetical protein
MTIILTGQESINQWNEKTYYSKRWNEFLRASQFCSEEFVCTSCFRESGELNKGVVRYDSLVQCSRHAPIAEKLNNQLRQILNHANAKIITDLGL